jgi:hypothetical protein
MTEKQLSLAAQPDPTRGGPVPAPDAIDAEPSIDPVDNDHGAPPDVAGRIDDEPSNPDGDAADPHKNRHERCSE